MTGKENEFEELLVEEEIDLRLKKYLSKIKKVFGEDYATLILSCDYDLKKSLDKFSSKFRGLDSLHIQFLLLQSALLSKDNPFKDAINKKMEEDNYYFLFSNIIGNIYFRKGLIRLYIDNCDKSNKELFDSLKTDEEKEIIIKNITELKRYERFLKVQEKMTQPNFAKRKKRTY